MSSATKKYTPAYEWPIGYKFCPTNLELVAYYLRNKVDKKPLALTIPEAQLYGEQSPFQLAETHMPIGEKEWYFFSPRDRKYPKGNRPRRSAGNGFWKATAADNEVKHDDKIVGFRKTLVYYTKEDGKTAKTNWIMQEYKLDEPSLDHNDGMRLDTWVLCKIYEHITGQISKQVEALPMEKAVLPVAGVALAATAPATEVAPIQKAAASEALECGHPMSNAYSKQQSVYCPPLPAPEAFHFASQYCDTSSLPIYLDDCDTSSLPIYLDDCDTSSLPIYLDDRIAHPTQSYYYEVTSSHRESTRQPQPLSGSTPTTHCPTINVD